MPKEFSPEEWKKIEENVDKAEIPKRQSKRASQELRVETGLSKAEREKAGNAAVIEAAGRKRVAKKALGREEDFEKAAEDILGEEGSPDRSLVGLRSKNLAKALREEHRIEKAYGILLGEETEILKTVDREPSGAEQEALGEIREELAALDKDREALLLSSPEAYIGLHLQELKGYKKELMAGRIVETPYVKGQAEDIVVHFNAAKPVLIYGHLGSGKSELAMHIARNYIGKEALIISGSKHTTLAELYGHQVLALDKIPKEALDEYANEVEKKYEAWVGKSEEKLKALSPEEREAEKNRAHERILQIYLTRFGGGTISDYFLGPIYRAMQEGRPVIIDEVNAIPHEILISLNHILTRRVGDKVNVQQNSGTSVEVKTGYGVMMTGNLNQGQEKYIDRQDMDPAFLSRLYKLEYDYLPQKTEGSLEAEAGFGNELFHLMLSRAIDKNGNLEAPRDSIVKLWNLAKAARVTEDVFAGREVSNAFYFQQGGGRSVRYLLKESVLSIRAIDNVITQWQKDGYNREIDYYLWKEFVSQSTVASDRAYLYQILKDRFGFFTSNGWEQNPTYGSGGVIASFDVKPPENVSGKSEFLGPREVVEFAYGKPPERKDWPKFDREGKMEEKAEEKMDLEALQNLEAFKKELEKDLGGLESEVGEFCEVEVGAGSGGAPPPPAKKKKGFFGIK